MCSRELFEDFFRDFSFNPLKIMSRNVPPFIKTCSAWMSKLHATCPKKDFEEEIFLESFENFLDVEP